MILDTGLFNQYISHGVSFRKLGPFDDAMGEMGPLDDAMMNWDSLITWWEIRGHHSDDMMRKFGALDGAMENLGPFALWWRNGEIDNP